MKSRLVQIIADYAPGDLAFAEIIAQLARHSPPETRWHTTTVESFNTVAMGFLVAQLGLSPHHSDGMLIYANCAPRQDSLQAREDNEGEGLLYGLTSADIPVLVVNSGYSLSFLRNQLKELWALDTPSAGSQFRSRDIFPEYVGRALKGDLTFRVKQLDPQRVIPAPPEKRIGYVDSFGNLKTTIRQGDDLVNTLESGARVPITINGVTRVARVVGGSFQVEQGDLAFAPGSSGHDRPFWEIFQRGGSLC